MSRAVVFSDYGGPEVLHVIDVDPPEPGPGQVRVAVEAAGVQPFDCLFRSGGAHQWVPAQFPQRLGNELAGVLDALGEGVGGLAVGDEVLGWAMLASCAEHVIVGADELVAKPEGMPWTHAGVLSASGQTAVSALRQLAVGAGDTVLVHAAAGGVGSFAVQIATALGARVVGTASERNHGHLRALGAAPVAYAHDLVERVRAAAPNGIDAALDAVGTEQSLRASLQLIAERERIGTTANSPLAGELGIRHLSTERSATQLAELADLYDRGQLRIDIQHAYPFEQAADAHRAVEGRHVRGKVVLTPRAGIQEAP